MPSSVIATVIVTLLTSSTDSAKEYRFDFGPSDSPVAEGYTGLDASAAYSPRRGYGWSAGAPRDYTAPKPQPRRTYWWHADPVHFFDQITNDFRHDGVESNEPFSFKMDLPKGGYRVEVTVGHLTQPRYSVDVYANGELVRKGVDARLWLFRGLLHKAAGYYKRVRFSVDVGEGGLVLDFQGDDAEFGRLMEIERAKGPDERPQSRFKNAPLGPEMAPFQDIGGPFSKMSLMGLEVYPEKSLPLRMDPETLELEANAASAADKAVEQAVTAFNSGQFDKAEGLFLTVSDPLVRGTGLLALAGRPDYENEIENTEAAVEALQEAAASPHADGNVRELLETAEIFLSGLNQFRYRGVPPNNGPVSTWRAAAEFDQFQPGDLVYHKAQIQQARFLIMLDAHQWCWCSVEGKKKLKDIEKLFPNNRYVQFYLYNKLAASPDWVSEDYLARTEDAPDWAAGLYAGYNLLVDISEWWAVNKQQADGSIGGGWGDDVELVGFFGFIARVSEGASPLSIECVRKLLKGVYASGQIDEVGGFFHGAADTEHSAEWTGKTLPMMLSVDYGNPLWVERALQSAKLMKEIWMGVNERGHLHWRSNFLGASGIGPQATHLDSSINWRAANPAVAVLRFTNNPVIKEMVLKHAEALHEDAMRTDKGKPKGIIPGEVDFETDEIGGRNVSTWYDPGDVPAKGNYGFAKFHGYRTRVMDLAYELSGDERFLEPIRLEAEYAREHGGDLTARIHKLRPGSPEWIAIVLKNSPELWANIQYERARKQGQDIRKTDRASIVENTVPYIPQIRTNMPYVTTEALATDRVGVPNSLIILNLLMGWTPTDPVPHLTYRHVGRDFAAAVLGADPTSLTALAYVFGFESETRKKMGFVPWKLELGAEYTAVWGQDRDGDDQMDSAEGRMDFTLSQRGQSVDLGLRTGKTYVVKITQTKPSPFDPLLADLAVGQEDVEYHAEWKLLFVTVHNIGAADAGQYEVIVTEQGSEKKMRAVGNSLDAPLDLTPKRTRFGFRFEPSHEQHQFDIVVQSLVAQPELTEINNAVSATLKFNE
jgi:hypothetical protein